jgi:hypothetical protein
MLYHKAPWQALGLAALLLFVFVAPVGLQAATKDPCAKLTGEPLTKCLRKYYDQFITPQKYNRNTYKCNYTTPRGVLPESKLTEPYNCKGLLPTKIRTIPQMQEPLCKAAQLAKADGCILEVYSDYRSFAEQRQLWCSDAAQKMTVDQRAAFYGVPGSSEHGLGQAIDVRFFCKGKLMVTNLMDQQCLQDKEAVKKLASYFYEASPDFVRFKNEIWHFEYGTASAKNTTRGHFYDSIDCKKVLLDLKFSGKGRGTVSISPDGGNCTMSCQQKLNIGATTTVSGVADNESIFAGFTGACKGNPSCNFVPKATTTVMAQFNINETPTATISSMLCSIKNKDKPSNGLADIQMQVAGTMGGPVGSYTTLPYWWPFTGNGAKVDCGAWTVFNANIGRCRRDIGQPRESKWYVATPSANTFYSLYKTQGARVTVTNPSMQAVSATIKVNCTTY